MYNKKVLKKALSELNSAKAPKKSKDIITDPMGQWKYPGQPTRIPSNNITMQGVNYPVLGVSNNGQKQMMQPGEDYTFPGADYVDEYPQMKRGGSKKKTKSMSGLNKLLETHPFFKNYKHRQFDPKAESFQDGGDVSPLEGDLISKVVMERNKDKDFVQRAYALGEKPGTPMFNVFEPDEFGQTMSHKMAYGEDDEGQTWMFPTVLNPKNEAVKVPNQYADYISREGYKKATGMISKDAESDNDYIETELTDDEIEEYRKGGYIVEDISVPELNQAQKGKTVKSKDGTITNTITKANGDTVIQVKNKNGEYYEKLIKKSDALDTLSKLQGAVKPEFLALGNAEAETKREEKQAKQKFLKEAWSNYDDWSTSDKVSDRVGAFLNDPFGMTARAITGDQAYIPGMAQGLHNHEDPEVRNRYLKELGYTPGEFDASDVQNMINPGYWASSFVENSRKGNIGTAALEGALMFLPHLPKGTVSKSNIRSGAKMLKNDVKNAGEYLTTKTPLKNAYKYNPWAFKPNSEAYYRVLGKEGVNDALESGIIRANPKNIDSFSGAPIYDRPFFSKGVPFDRDWKSPFKNKKGKQSVGSIYPDETMVEVFGHDKFHKTGDLVTSPIDVLNSSDEGINFYKRDWLKGYKEVPKQLPGSPNAANDIQKAGFLNPFAIADRIIPRLPTPLNYFGVESSWNNVSPLNLIPGYGKKLFNKTDKLPVGFRKFGNSLEHVKTSKTLSPKGGSRMGAKQIESEGNWAEPNKVNEAYNGVFEATMDPNIEGSNIKLEKWNNRNGIVGTTKEGDVAIPITDPGLSFNRRLPFSNKYVSIDKQKLIDGKFQLATQLPHVQSLIGINCRTCYSFGIYDRW
jgi:hypothetical protein